MTDTLVRPQAVFYTSGDHQMGSQQVVQKFAKGSDTKITVLEVKGKPIFRSGTFRDSWGDQMTWGDLQIKQMATHFQYLFDNGIFADVPVRVNHPGFAGNVMRDVIGYFTDLRAEKHTSPVDSVEYTYVVADYDIIDPEAIQKISSGLWRNRSAEIGAFVTNDEQEFYPTMMGVAYVDIPAVEGLNFSKNDFGFIGQKGIEQMAKKDEGSGILPRPGVHSPGTGVFEAAAADKPKAAAAPKPADPAGPNADDKADDKNPTNAPATPVENLEPEGDPEDEPGGPEATGAPAGQPGTAPAGPEPLPDELLDIFGEDSEPLPSENQAEPGAVGVPNEEQAKADAKEKKKKDPEYSEEDDPISSPTELEPGAVFARHDPKTGMFTVAGKSVSGDQMAELLNRQYKRARVAELSRRNDTVAQLAADGYVLASSLEEMTAFTAGLSPKAFESWLNLTKAAGPSPLFARQNAVGGGVNPGSEEIRKAFEADSGIVQQHVLRNMAPDKVKAKDSYKRASAAAEELGIDWDPFKK